MIGPEHYKEAERLIEFTNKYDGLLPDETDISPWSDYMLRRAQVHATLALAAAVGAKP